VYKKVATKANVASLLIAPICIWLVINFLILEEYKGAGFLIIPVFIALITLALLIFGNPKKNFTVLFAILAIPTLYMLAPMVKLFPVGLGLKNLMISGIVISLLFGLLLPVLLGTSKKTVSRMAFVLMLFLFIKASFSAGFSNENKRPNSLVYIKNIHSNTAYWGSYNTILDPYTKQKLGDTPVQGGIPNADTKSKYNTRFNYHTVAENKEIPYADIRFTKDTIVGESRLIHFDLTPKRTLHKVEFISAGAIHFDSLTVNNAAVNAGKPFAIKNGSFLIYHMGNEDPKISIAMSIPKDSIPEISINEISYDLLENPLFTITPRSDDMMPMPFVTNDAVISIQKLKI
jgi:general stress protein CsbA